MWCSVLSALALSSCASAPPSAPAAGAVSGDVLPGWTEFVLPGKRSTRYEPGWEDGRRIVRARADASASMLRRRVHIEPDQLGGIQFSWKVVALIEGADLNDADASDSPVRLVLAFDGDVGRLSQRNRMLFDLAHAVSGEPPPFATLMYVWDNHAPLETVIHSRRTDRVRKIVVESGEAGRGRWRHYQRDVAADFRRAFGEEPGALVGVALMTDADNTRARAEGSYGEVRLLAPVSRGR
jgi:Protein of unknown function (DUF3047)